MAYVYIKQFSKYPDLDPVADSNKQNSKSNSQKQFSNNSLTDELENIGNSIESAKSLTGIKSILFDLINLIQQIVNKI